MNARTLPEILWNRVETSGSAVALHVLGDGDSLTETLTYADLHRRACQVAVMLQEEPCVGERALLLFENLTEYVAAFFGCLYAGVIAVPAFPPSPSQPRQLQRVLGIANSAAPKFVLTQRSLLEPIRTIVPHAVATDGLQGSDAGAWRRPQVTPEMLAFLQYTSGSTAQPKGVRVSHRNLLANERVIREGFGMGSDDVVVSWLPLYHDMGLIGGLLQPIYSGVPAVLMSPAHFIERPVRWLRAIARFQGTVSGGPNFAYRLCAERITAAQLQDVSLQSWRLAFCGAEPIRASTLREFADAFQQAGFDRAALYPCYGLAESTLYVTGGRRGEGVKTTQLESTSSEATGIVNCGRAAREHEVIIVDPATQQRVAEGEIGEIRTRGPSVAEGYWQDAAATEATFVQGVAGIELRTGDLGFLQNGQLFVTGRLKDLILLRGMNVYPQDLEVVIEQEIELLRRGRVSAFPVETDASSGVGIAAEVSRSVQKLVEPERLFAAIDAAVASVCGEIPRIILLLQPGALPRTSSGKLQRSACLRQWRAGELDVFASRDEERVAAGASSERETSPVGTSAARLAALWKEVLKRPVESGSDHFLLVGGNSLSAAQLAARIAETFAIDFGLREVIEHPTFDDLSRAIDRAQSSVAGTSSVPLVAGTPDHSMELSHAQERMWFLWKLEPESTAYHVAGGLRLSGTLDLHALRRALDAIVARHSVLRARFVEHDGRARQSIEPALPVALETIALDDAEDALLTTLGQLTNRPFDLERGPLLRAALVRLSDAEAVLWVTVHHIAADGMSMQLLVDEFLHGYEAAVGARVAGLPALPIQYADYARWQRGWLAAGGHDDQLEYWRNQLGTAHPMLSLPFDRPRPSQKRYAGASVSFELPAALISEIRSFAHAHDATPFMVLLASLQAVLHRYSGQTDIRVGVPVANRKQRELEPLIGFFMNTLVLRATVTGQASFRQLLKQVRQLALDAQAHADLPFERLVEALNPERSLAHNPLFQVMYNHRRAPSVERRLGDAVDVKLQDGAPQAAQFDLSLDTIERDESWSAIWTYDLDLFEGATIERLGRHWLQWLTAALREPNIRIDRVCWLSPDEVVHLSERVNETHTHHGAGLVHELIHTKAMQVREACALIFGDAEVSYGALDARANQLAHCLIAHGVGPESIVGVFAERSIEMVTALLAVMKAGGAYLPLDPDLPAERLSYILQDAGPAVVLTQASLRHLLPASQSVVLLLDGPHIDRQPTTAVQVEVLPAHPAYCIYTSGSTGRPKGTLNTHAGLWNRLQWMQSAYALTSADRVLQKTPFGFDVSVWEFFWPLMTGATLVIAPPGAHREPRQLRQVIDRHSITTLHFVPSMLQAFVAADELRGNRSIRQILCSGEALPYDLQQRVLAQHPAKLHNLYGPTEAAIDVTAWQCIGMDARATVPIGRPIDNVQIHLLDAHFAPAPVGVAAELYIGGIALARGYLNRRSLTADRFIPHPLATTPGERLYRTGDLARRRADGAIEYLGRVDQQVKIRGVRIELEEIDSRLREHAEVRDAAVVANDDAPGGTRLCAYVVARNISSEAQPEWATLRLSLIEHLQRQLPEAMVPVHYTLLAQLPVNSNGKLDRKALPAPSAAISLREYVAPRNEIEQALAEIWSAVLSVDRVGVREDFFELGGHSLLATQVVSRLRQRFLLDVPLKSLFEAPTIAELAGRIQALRSASGATSGSTIPVASREGPLPLSHAQQRLWFLWQLNPQSLAYHICAAATLRGALNREALARAVSALTDRHEALRTIFPSVDGEPRQRILAAADIEMSTPGDVDAPFDLERGPLLRWSLRAEAPGEHTLLLTLHHIVADGWSLNVIMRELVVLYDAFVAGEPSPLPALPIQYADYAIWQRGRMQGEERQRQIDYWKQRLGAEQRVLELPTDRPRRGASNNQGARYSFALDDQLVSRLRAFALSRNVTPYMVLLTAFKILLYRYTRQNDISIGATVANRNRLETEGLVGFFVNMQVLRSSVTEEQSGEHLLQQIRGATLEAQAYQDLPFDVLVEALNPERSLSHDPLFKVTVNHQWRDYDVLKRAVALRIEAVDRDVQITQFDLTLNTDESAGAIAASFTYRVELFERQTIERMAAHWTRLLDALIREPESSVGAMTMLSDDEQRTLLQFGRGPRAESARNQFVHQLFERQAALNPDAIALDAGRFEVSYAELNSRANQVAHRLIALGIGPDRLVGVFLDRSVDMLVALLAVLKAGGAYVPLEPDYPAERIAYVLDDARPSVVLTTARLLERLPASGATSVCVEQITANASDGKVNPPLRVHPLNLAYCIYTSGSTGRPKGSHIAHHSFAHYVTWASSFYFDTDAEQGNFGLHSPLAFDLTVTSLFVPLVRGRTLSVFDVDMPLDEIFTRSFAVRSRIDSIKLTPSHIALLGRLELPETRVRRAIVGGEALLPEHIAQLKRLNPSMAIYNEYGPTEATVGCIVKQVAAEEDAVCIGRPIAGFVTYILDARGALAPIGVMGELYIGGPGLARGYLNRPSLTASRFVPDHFGSEPGARLYRTGDLARYRANGEIEYGGRVDQQVKIRGFRVELGEIEARLRELDGVRDAVVLAQDGHAGSKQLMAYVVPDSARLKELHREGTQRDELVEQWQLVFSGSYGDRATAPSFAGWNSSYTEERIPDAQMQEWLDRTVERILALHPQRVLEIGCGVGLIAQHVAPSCPVYRGTDFSKEALNTLGQWLQSRPELSHVELALADAAQAATGRSGAYDLVILNSVVQYFPDLGYLRRTIEAAFEALAPGGYLFIGDVRHLGLLEAFHASVQLHRAPSQLPARQLRSRIEKAITHDKELVIDPRFFQAIVDGLGLQVVDIALKRGRFDNELTRYRYDVVLRKSCDASRGQPSDDVVSGVDGCSDFADIQRLLAAKPESLRIRGITNRRVCRDLRLLSMLATCDGRATVDSLRRALDAEAAVGGDPESFCALGEAHGYETKVMWSPLGAGHFDVEWLRPGSQRSESSNAYRAAFDRDIEWSEYANDPLDAQLRQGLPARLREHLVNALPDYMVPTQWAVLTRLPLTANGKLDRDALPQPEAGDHEHGFVEPRSGAERTLASIWQQLLGVSAVGAHDNFFALGGDSIVAIQVVSKAKRAGLALTPRDLFRHQTIAALAAVATSVTEEPAGSDQQERGDVPLTPIQQDFFALPVENRAHWNQSVLLDCTKPLDSAQLEQALQQLVEHHDSLRLRFTWQSGEWRQTYVEVPPFVRVSAVDLRADADTSQSLLRHADELQRSLDLEHGPLLAASCLRLPEDRCHVLLVIHHLVVDAVSWRILIEDLTTLLRAVGGGARDWLPRKTTSFKRWSQLLRELAASDAWQSERSYWRSMMDVPAPSLPIARADGVNSVESQRTLEFTFDASVTEQLLKRAPTAYRTQVNDLLLTAFAEAVAEWSGSRSVLIDLEGHGREELVEGVDLTRTVGWFTTVYPVRLTPEPGDHAASIKAIKEQLRAIPRHGLGYGLLRDPDAAPPAIAFNYLGRVTPPADEGGELKLVQFSVGQERCPEALRRHWLEVNGAVQDDQLRLAITFSRNLHDDSQIQALLDGCSARLHALVAHCVAGDHYGVTPSDFPLARITQAQLDALPLAPHAIENIHALTPMQEGLLFHSLMESARGMYVNQHACRIDAPLDVESLRSAWQEVVDAYDVLRASFTWSLTERPLQITHRNVQLPFHVRDWSDLTPVQQEAELTTLLEDDLAQGFDLTQAPLLRVTVARLGGDRYRLVWTDHHLLCDGWSSVQLMADVLSRYDAKVSGRSSATAAPVPFSRYIEWLQGQDSTHAESFWRETLAGFDTPSLLTKHLPACPRGEGDDTLERRLSQSLYERLQAMAKRSRITLSTLMQGATILLLGQYTRQSDVVLGTTVSGRDVPLPGIERMLGMFINTIPLRARLQPAQVVEEWLQDLQEWSVRAREHDHLPLTSLQRYTDVPPGTALFDVLLVIENFPIGELIAASAARLNMADFRFSSRTNYPLTLTVVGGDSCQLRFDYDRRLFDASLVARLANQLERILTTFLAAPRQVLGAVELTSDTDRKAVLDAWNASRPCVESATCVHALFEEQVARTPSALALVFEQEQLTYAELNLRANALAHQLRRQGVGPDMLVGICMERSIELVVALLGVLKAGGAYVPLDPALPLERLQYMVEDARPRVVLVQAAVLPLVKAVTLPEDTHVIAVTDSTTVEPGDRGNPAHVTRSDHLVYCIYTSGSTGRPKGTGNTHAGLLNRLRWGQRRYALTENDRLLQKTPFSFDVSVGEFFWPLTSGATLVMAPPGAHKDPVALRTQIVRHQVTTVHFVPSMLQAFLDARELPRCSSLRQVFCSGEALSTQTAGAFRQQHPADLHNLYGPTETSIEVSEWQYVGDEQTASVPIGRPIDATEIYLLSPTMTLVPPGVAGELCIAGVSLARGYLNRAALTAERFIPHPFKPGQRLYRTGDLARQRDDGVIEFIGRLDQQVKVRGFRIELGEIDAQLLRCPQVREAVSLVREDRIISYVTVAETHDVVPLLLAQLRAVLPDYMVPTHIVVIEAWPLTPSGKLDRKSLPAPALVQHSDGFVAPRTELERQLASIWSEVLQVERVGVHDSFFALGGHSLLATQVAFQLRTQLQIVLPLRELFELDTIDKLATHLQSAATVPMTDALDQLERMLEEVERQ